MYFPTLARSKGRLLALTIASPDANPGDAVTAWLVRTAQRIPGHVRCHASAPIEEGFGLQANLITSNPEADITYPKGLLYSPLSSCNMNCIHCISRATRPRAIRLSERIRQDIKAHAQEQQLNWMFTDYSGDIFFAEHKQPGELDFIFSLGIAIHIDTNAAYLDAAMIEKVMASPVDALSISIDAAQDDTYRRIRVGSPPIGQVFDTAKAVVAERARQGRQSNFRVYLGFTMMRSNLHELPLFIQKAADAGVDAVGCRHLELYHADMEDESLFHHKAYFNSMRAACLALAKSLNINLNIGEELWEHPASGGRAPCPTPWSSAVLLANGDLMACCVPGSKMGNVNDQPIEALWQGEAYRRLRARVNSQDPPSLCKSCPFRNSLNDYANPQALRAGLSAVPLLEELMADTGRG
ncbi:radical SAM/SPASM domain-containing protein [Methylovulum psychrotolerans]|uniref:Pyrroloquinoline quinone biosynthesis protein PqqE n=1 Tax=Methylovulum psychrotolerans TaxID=1704499 RepID=A0A2S5CQF8_9GAMM|nr:radical SAM protein [Methylovulum psychrotolerans]POZ51795.1 pyrroloquinoline quinone biosynthesis protein PqqE [Methylovulum psychrotolerans]POZ52283.1 pyrroloquinoline quinone biosynthesis protein PqqE [Methylovulum psychrotolerans]POZ53034.1 pyrroloquinoline quinone biosynthesis protein PqqE [Methylovulum psychrotolerans]